MAEDDLAGGEISGGKLDEQFANADLKDAQSRTLQRWILFGVAITIVLLLFGSFLCFAFQFMDALYGQGMKHAWEAQELVKITAPGAKAVPAPVTKSAIDVSISMDWHVLLLASEFVIPATILMIVLMRAVFKDQAPEPEPKETQSESEFMKALTAIIKEIPKLMAKQGPTE